MTTRAAVFLVAALFGARTIVAAGDESPLRVVADDADPTRVTVSYVLQADVVAEFGERTIAEAMGRKRLTLAVVTDGDSSATPILGDYALDGSTLTFRPRFGLVRGETYRATAFGADATAVATVDYRPADAVPAEPTKLVSITPRGETLPANVLRFYLTFSAPMREGREVLERIRLVDPDGREIGAPWRDLELWNADATRLSLFLHPGRIKKGVNLREELGPLLLPGTTYQIVVEASLRDATGRPLGREYRRTIRTADELRTPIDVARWTIRFVEVGSRDPLRVSFDRPLDAALVERCLEVRESEGRAVSGRGALDPTQKSWTFHPTHPWKHRAYRLDIDPVLEDVCGNTPIRAFDTDLEATPTKETPPMLRREFTPVSREAKPSARSAPRRG
jgi:hypothetical protein